MLKLKRKHRLCKTYSWYQKQKGVFHILKDALLHFKRASFTMQKGVFYYAKEALLLCYL